MGDIQFDMGNIFSMILSLMGSLVHFLRGTVISFGGFSLSLWDLSLAALILGAVLMVVFPHFDADDMED